jgi:hypothetical protein
LNGRNITIDFLEVMLCCLFQLLVVVRNIAVCCPAKQGCGPMPCAYA